MAYTTINKSTDYFNTKLYTGNGSSNAITGVGFQPDWVWGKCRNDTHNHQVFDAVRGVHNRIRTDTNGAQTTSNESLKSFDSDGFTLGTQTNINQNSLTYASWNWKAGGGQGSANTDGSINTIYTSVNTTAGFSISRFDGTGANATVGHGLGAVPKMIIVKNLDSEEAWTVYHGANTSEPQTERLYLNLTNATSDSASSWNDTAPTSTVFTVGASGETNANGAATIAYCFSEKVGYSKFGSYTGNNNANGTFIYTGFSPAFIMVKKTSGTGGWQLRDNKRTPYGNETLNLMYANASSVEQTTDGFDFLSNGFKWRNQASDCNGNGDYIYMAFAENPFTSSAGTPVTAR